MSLSPDDVPNSLPPGQPEAVPAPRPSLSAWLREGARTALLLRPRWHGLHTGPAMMAVLLLLSLAISMLIQRLYVEGAARFYWQAINTGWLSLALLPWCAWLVRGKGNAAAPDTPRLFTLLQAQGVALTVLTGALYLAMIYGRLDTSKLGPAATTAIWTAPPVFALLPQMLLLWRGGNREPLPAATAMLVLTGCLVLNFVARPVDFWYPLEGEEAEPRQLALSQELIEAQPRMLNEELSTLKPQRPGKVDMYAITFAPYYADVFKRESGVVAQVIAQRFGAEGRVLQLVNHVDTASILPWATPLNLQRAITQLAQVMDRNEDILFIHLTSHGAANGQLAARFSPLAMQELTPQQLRQWLDQAGIRNRVISVSACYSGSWIAPLENDDTLVMTAADANHTSYGCGRKSELTFFGRAMYDEQLRSSTRSFEQAHASARKLILKREEDAGKTDGYSNPQISVGPSIRARLARMDDQL
jgi:hypothetical protein